LELGYHDGWCFGVLCENLLNSLWFIEMVNEVVLWDEDVKAFKKLLFDKQLNHPEEVT
jgi:hypothetical protein